MAKTLVLKAVRLLRDMPRALSVARQPWEGSTLTLRASALTFVSVFSLLPALAVAVAVLREGVGYGLHQRLQVFILKNLAPGIREDSLVLFQKSFAKASANAAGLVGFILLFVSAASLVRNLAGALNEVWNIRTKPHWRHTAVVHLMVLVVGPPVMALSLLATRALQHYWAPERTVASYLWLVGSLAAEVLSLTVLYWFVPFVQVKLRAALGGALMAAVSWEILKHVYAGLAQLLFRQNPIFGTLGAVPIFLAWVYVGWFTLLGGARVAYAIQHLRVAKVWTQRPLSVRTREVLASRIIQAVVARDGASKKDVVSAASLSQFLNVPKEAIDEVVQALLRSRVLEGVSEDLVCKRAMPSLAEVFLACDVPGFTVRDCEEAGHPFQFVFDAWESVDGVSLDAMKRISLSHPASKATGPTGGSK